MVAAILYQLTRNLTPAEIKAGGFDKYFVGHGDGIYPCAASGEAFTAMAISSKGDHISDLEEDLAAEQKARVTYDNILRLSDDPDVNDAIKFLRQREIVHFQRFGEALRSLTKWCFATKSIFDGINPTRSDEIAKAMKSSLREGDRLE